MKFLATIHLTIIFTILLSSFIQVSKAQHWSRGFNPLGKRSADNWFRVGSKKSTTTNPETSENPGNYLIEFLHPYDTMTL